MFDLDFADVKPSLINWLIVGFSAATFIVFMKWLLNRRPVPGLTEFVNAI
jgi:riboflavin transporter FmnP